MQMLINCLAVGAGGALGSIARYLISKAMPSPALSSTATDPASAAALLSAFPFATLLINIAGSFAIGAIMGASLHPSALSEEQMLFFKVGVCGGFTTFSTFSLETMQLMQTGHTMIAALYAATSVLTCVAAAFAGHWAACAIRVH